MDLLESFHIICGHYGCGKTNLALNLAMDLVREGKKVTLVDLDIVNPYFRSSDYEELLEEKGIQLIAPIFAHTNVDMPALPAELESIFSMRDRMIIIDVGGDDAGAVALGRYAHTIRQMGRFSMHYVVNCYRALTTQPEEAVALLREIEAACRLKATGVVNNSHMQDLTTGEDILRSVDYAKKTAELLGLPLVTNTCPRALYPDLSAKVTPLYPVDRYVRPPWEAGE